MNKNLFKNKILSLLCVSIFCVSLIACGSDKEAAAPAEADNGLTAATKFSFAVEEGEELFMENLSFAEDVTVSGDNGSVVFVNCEFQGNITNTASLGTRVILQDSTVSGKCIFQNDGKEATLDTSLPKFLSTSSIDAVCEDCYGSVVALGDFEITLNDETYSLETAEHFYDNGLVPYEGQDADVFCAAQWWENGEYVLLTLAEAE